MDLIFNLGIENNKYINRIDKSTLISGNVSDQSTSFNGLSCIRVKDDITIDMSQLKTKLTSGIMTITFFYTVNNFNANSMDDARGQGWNAHISFNASRTSGPKWVSLPVKQYHGGKLNADFISFSTYNVNTSAKVNNSNFNTSYIFNNIQYKFVEYIIPTNTRDVYTYINGYKIDKVRETGPQYALDLNTLYNIRINHASSENTDRVTNSKIYDFSIFNGYYHTSNYTDDIPLKGIYREWLTEHMYNMYSDKEKNIYNY